MRHFLHVLASLLMWCLFGYYWYLVSQRGIGRESIEAVGTLALVVVSGLVSTLWWVAHNKKLARRNRRSNPPPAKPEPFDKDNLGRPIEAPEREVLRAASIVEIAVIAGDASEGAGDADEPDEEDGIKVYTAIQRKGVPDGPVSVHGHRAG